MTSRRMWLWVAALSLLATARIISTFQTFSQFYDEPFHIACGMEWLDKGTYNYERQHPPLARICEALPLYLMGQHSSLLPSAFDEGNQILNKGDYATNLVWARAGNLPFFWISVILLAAMVQRYWDERTAVMAVGLFTLLPLILGHAGVATTDMAAVAGFMAGLYGFSRWLEQPSVRQAAWFGVALGFAALAKFSDVPFLGVGFFFTLLWLLLRCTSRPPWPALGWKQYALQGSLMVFIAAMITWAPYYFRLASVITDHGYRPPAAMFGPLGGFADWVLDTRWPLGEWLGGIGGVAVHSRAGHMSFLMGEARLTGWWYYFPLGLALKTPLTFLLLLLIGTVALCRKQKNLFRTLPLLFGAGILMICLTSGINIGIRHIIPIYAMASIIAAEGVWKLERIPRFGRFVAIVAIIGLVGESAWAHPDYVAYFNPLAGKHPERILVNSDLDGGQDLHRLTVRLKQLGVTSLSIAYFGTVDLERAGLPPFVPLGPQERPGGWVAVSALNLTQQCAALGDYCWLNQETPVERVGRSIFLFHFPSTSQ